MSVPNNRKVFLVTGATSNIGKALQRAYLSHPETFGGELIFDLGDWRLGKPLLVNNPEARLLHLAHDRSMTLHETRVALELLGPLIRPGSLFISTVSAHEASKSLYGKKKFFEENYFLSSNATVIKSGLVISNEPAAMYLKLLTMLSYTPFVPMPYYGDSRIYVTKIESLIDLIKELTNNSAERMIVRAFNRQPYKLKDLLRKMSSQNHLKRVLIPIPKWLSNTLIYVGSLIFPKNSTIDSLKSLTHEISEQDLMTFLVPNIEFPDF